MVIRIMIISLVMDVELHDNFRIDCLHGVRQVDVRTRTDVFLAGFYGPAKRGCKFLEHRCTMYLRLTFTVKKSKESR
jgi:hypothetical protein